MPLNEKIPWENSYKVGVKDIDAQHKKLFEIVNRLYDLKDGQKHKEELRAILYEFNDYMKIHFEDEERFMLSIDYPALEEHKQIHKDIIEFLSKIIQTPAKLAIIKTKMRVVAKRFLIDHILKEDTKIKLFLVNKAKEEEVIEDLV